MKRDFVAIGQEYTRCCIFVHVFLFVCFLNSLFSLQIMSPIITEDSSLQFIPNKFNKFGVQENEPLSSECLLEYFNKCTECFSWQIGAETCLNVQLWPRWLYSALKEPSAAITSDKGDVCTDPYSLMIIIAGTHSDSIPYCYWWSQTREGEVYRTPTVDEEKRHTAGEPNGSMGSHRSEALLSQAELPKRRPQSQSKA